MPQLFELAAMRLALRECRVLVGEGQVQLSLSRTALALRAARLPLEATAALTRVGAETSQLARGRRHSRPAATEGGKRDAVLAIWPGYPGTKVGGSVTHMSGVLAAFRHLGLRVGLLTLGPPPPQLQEIADDIQVAPPLSREARLTGEIAAVCSNPVARAAGRQLLRRLRPRLVYQRHEAFATYGVQLAEAADAPLVLEWNNSEAWVHFHWHLANPVKRVFTPLAATMERYVVQRAALVASVSSHSAAMALDAGASPDAVLVLPNGVDIEVIERARRAAAPVSSGPGTLLGWVGSFEPWHGADVLVRALARLPESVHALLVGDGPERARCQYLAQELGVAQRIEWTGLLPHFETVQRLAGCDVLVSPHPPMQGRPFFGSPTKVFEYMALGRPIVASGLEQIGEILNHNRTAILVTPGDTEDLARGIQVVLALPDRGHRLGMAAQHEAESSHTWDARVQVILDRLTYNGGGEAAEVVDLQAAGERL